MWWIYDGVGLVMELGVGKNVACDGCGYMRELGVGGSLACE